MEVDTDSKRCCEKSEPNFSTEDLEILYSISSNIDISDIAKYSKIFKHNLINLKFDFEFSNINLDCLKLNTQQWLLKNFFLDNYNLVYFKIKGDGNFFFRAICLFFLGDQKYHDLFRKYLRNYNEATVEFFKKLKKVTRKKSNFEMGIRYRYHPSKYAD